MKIFFKINKKYFFIGKLINTFVNKNKINIKY